MWASGSQGKTIPNTILCRTEVLYKGQFSLQCHGFLVQDQNCHEAPHKFIIQSKLVGFHITCNDTMKQFFFRKFQVSKRKKVQKPRKYIHGEQIHSFTLRLGEVGRCRNICLFPRAFFSLSMHCLQQLGTRHWATLSQCVHSYFLT